MGVLYKLDRSGHGEVAKWGDDQESRDAGAKAFEELKARHFTMFDKNTPRPPLQEFDPEATEIIAVPQLVAG